MITLTNICTEFCDNLCRAVFVGLNFVLKPCSLCSVQDFQLRPINMCLYRVHKYKHKSTRTHTHSGRQAKGKIASNTQTNTEIFYCASSKKKTTRETETETERETRSQAASTSTSSTCSSSACSPPSFCFRLWSSAILCSTLGTLSLSGSA